MAANGMAIYSFLYIESFECWEIWISLDTGGECSIKSCYLVTFFYDVKGSGPSSHTWGDRGKTLAPVVNPSVLFPRELETARMPSPWDPNM